MQTMSREDKKTEVARARGFASWLSVRVEIRLFGELIKTFEFPPKK